MDEVEVEKVIYNCHVHTFTIDHVPSLSRFRILKWLMRRRTIQRIVIPLLKCLARIRRFQHYARYANYLTITANKKQEGVLDLLRQRYPRSTRFVVLPMDLAYMWGTEPSEPKAGIDEQHRELIELRDKSSGVVIPFFAVDPRRPDALDKLRRGVEKDGFRGIKLYPNLGFPPDHPGMEKIWEYADERALPVMTHCSRGGVHGYDVRTGQKVNEESADHYGAPHLYVPILQRYPRMRLCLAHLGGQKEWESYLMNPWPVENTPLEKRSWLAQILSMIPDHPNLYSDISYTVFYFQDFAPALKVFLADEVVRKRILFGSDYYMAELEKFSERLLSINLRAALGERLFWQIANTNPKAFLQ